MFCTHICFGTDSVNKIYKNQYNNICCEYEHKYQAGHHHWDTVYYNMQMDKYKNKKI